MSVLIKGMNMPLDCSNCDFCRIVDGHYYCDRTKHKISVYYGSRQGDCPIINIPTPHGRLIDADELTKHMRGYYPSIDHLCRSQHVVTKGDIDKTPTIIEAEVSEE